MAETKQRVRVQAGRENVVKTSQAVAKIEKIETPAEAAMSALARAAADPRVDAEKIDKLYETQRKMALDQARIDFDYSFVDLQADLSGVVITQDRKIEVRQKDGSGERTGKVQQSTPYASFTGIMQVVQPHLTRHGFGLSFSTEPSADGTRLLVHGILSRRGHERRTTFPLPAETSGSKNNVQGWGSSMSYGKRYATIALLNIVSYAPEDQDTDGNEGRFKVARAKEGGEILIEDKQVEVISEEQAVELIDLIEWCTIGTKKFCEHFGVKRIAALPASMFETAKNDCKNYHANLVKKGVIR